jgi:hypothetical protein
MKFLLAFLFLFVNFSGAAQNSIDDFEDITFHLRSEKNSSPAISLFMKSDRSVVLWRKDSSQKEGQPSGLFKGIIDEENYTTIKNLLRDCKFVKLGTRKEPANYPTVDVIASYDGFSWRFQSELDNGPNSSNSKLANYLIEYIGKSKFVKSKGFFDFEL